MNLYRILVLAGMIAIATPQIVRAQSDSPAHDQPALHLENNPYMRYSNPHLWEIRQKFCFMSPNSMPIRRDGGSDGDDEESEWFMPIYLANDQFSYPIVELSSSSWIDPLSEPEQSFVIRSAQRAFETIERSDERTLVFDPHLKIGDSFVMFRMNTRVYCVDTELNEEQALRLGWTKTLPDGLDLYLTPIMDSLGETDDPYNQSSLAEIPDEQRVLDLVNEWIGHEERTSIAPVLLAKFLAAKVIAHVRPLDPALHEFTEKSLFAKMLRFNNLDDSIYELNSGEHYIGFGVQSVSSTARTGRGSRHDMVSLYTSTLRAVGVPARTMIGLEANAKGHRVIKSWAEFALFDPESEIVFWVPVDLDELRRSKVSPRDIRKPWKYFGSHDKLHRIAPISTYFHPPETLKSYRFPALYGLIPDKSRMPFLQEQFFRYAIDEPG